MQNNLVSKLPSLVRAKKGQSRIRGNILLWAAIFLFLGGPTGGRAWAQAIPGFYDVLVAWDAVPDSGVIGYRVHYGVASGIYEETLDVGNTTTATVKGLVGGLTYYIAVTAVGAGGLESEYSEEVRVVPGLHGIRIGVNGAGARVLTVQGLAGREYDIEATTDFKSWVRLSTVTVGEGGSVTFSDAAATRVPNRFYRTRSRF
jgi:Fibronectin type III domain